ncbi:ThuA domain-containing protein [Paenibacillus sp. JX-17]|uniref:ThuA domain-containing protein n=1 Tax=Paenibacillus lacisoli TaxID=3064525 RepID=A0ABT9CB33_9BACL|nr:ThuA domain-containing protein [Paenibacillus sp. JX-17]MDO7906451.1 ThuA domain-containing protein [Paenibacillus sp. JX-17]
MDHKKKTLLLGDYTHPDFHPLQGVDAEISHILSDWSTVSCSENRKMLLLENLGAFDLCISYLDEWREPVSPRQTAGLLSYVSSGGGLVVMHNAISMQNRYEIAQMIGAKFKGHPPYAPLDFTVKEPDHPVMEGIEAFTLEEEPYRFEFELFGERTILMEYRDEEGTFPAAWAQSYGLGRVVYLMPGHHVASFQHPAVRRLLLQAARWAGRFPG